MSRLKFTKEMFANWKPHALSSGFTPDYEDMAELAQEVYDKHLEEAPTLFVHDKDQTSINFPNDQVRDPPFTAKLIFDHNDKGPGEQIWDEIQRMKKEGMDEPS